MRRNWLLRGLVVACCVLASQARADDLADAFEAVYGQPPPATTLVAPPYAGLTPIWDPYFHKLVLTPGRLIRLAKNQWALVVSETDTNANHLEAGAVSIIYLRHDGASWKAEKAWQELDWIGSLGVPFDDTMAVNFWSEPLFIASSQWNGQGTSVDMTIFALGKKGPRLLGTVPGGGSTDYEAGDDVRGAECESYYFTGNLGPPSSKPNILSMTYFGWTAPPGMDRPRHWFWVTTDFASKSDELVATPAITIPDCAR